MPKSPIGGMYESSVNPVLELAARILGDERPPVPPSLRFTLDFESEVWGTLARLWFRTRGCRHTHRGGCAMCDYWISSEVNPSEMIASVREGLSKLEAPPSTLLLNTSGSFLDSWEVPDVARREILKAIREARPAAVTFETRADTVTEDKVAECVAILSPARTAVELGVESTDDWILRFCVNKRMRGHDLRHAVNIIVGRGAIAVANVLVGLPFLSAGEQVADSVGSISDSFGMGFGHCVLLPVNTKQFTIINWMEERGLYARPPLWALVDVLCRTDPSLFPRIDIAWHRPQPDYHPSYVSRYRGPETCALCFERVAGLFDEWRGSREREALLNRITSLRCECRERWDEARRAAHTDLRTRVIQAYKRITDELLGDGVWDRVTAPFTAMMPEHRIRGTAQ